MNPQNKEIMDQFYHILTQIFIMAQLNLDNYEKTFK